MPAPSEPLEAESKQSFDSKSFLAQQKNQPGIYQMFNDAGAVLYVGKAKALKKRLSSYFQKKSSSENAISKTKHLVSKIGRIEVTITATETEALLLEQNLIKKYKPPYNILLRDDKSYPYIYVSTEHDYPRIDIHRGSKRLKGRYFGPYPSAGSVRESLQFLQKSFRVRQCTDAFFSNRSRPCLQYQIKRCTGPCVKAAESEQYNQDVRHTLLFLEGKEDILLKELADMMEASSAQQQYEHAALYRDKITHLRHVRETQSVEEGDKDVDVIAIASKEDIACVQVVTIRQGRILGSRSYFPSNKLIETEEEVLASFLSQYYLGYEERQIPPQIIIDRPLLDNINILIDVLSARANRKVQFFYKLRGHRLRWKELASRSAEQNLLSRVSSEKNTHKRFEQLQKFLSLEQVPERIECFDISHSSGEATVASCVVFDGKGPLKADYRRFNIEGIQAGDDYAAMKQALERRYLRVQNEDGKLPDILLIDGGKGQLTQARAVIEELQLRDIFLIGIAKGSTRKAGFETLILQNENGRVVEKVLDSTHGALHLLQQVRDEAHRFAITGHKQRRDKKRQVSTMEAIPGVGAKRRKELLRFFGGRQEIASAGVDELQKVPGINRALAQTIYDAFRS